MRCRSPRSGPFRRRGLREIDDNCIRPALKRLGEAFGQGIFAGLVKAKLTSADVQAVRIYATPRRLAALIPDVLGQAADRAESKKLMPSKVAFGADGKPTAALMKRLEGLILRLGDISEIVVQ